MEKNLIQTIKVIILGTILFVGVAYAGTWKNPTTNPTGNNADGFLNVSANPQIKGGTTLISNTLLSLIGNLGIGGNVVVKGNGTFNKLGGDATNSIKVCATKNGTLVPCKISPSIKCVIDSFSANPNSVYSGNTSNLSWTTTNCDTATIQELSGSQIYPPNGSTNSKPLNTTSATYTLNSKNGTTSDTKTVTIVAQSLSVGPIMVTENNSLQCIHGNDLVGDDIYTFSSGAVTGALLPLSYKWEASINGSSYYEVSTTTSFSLGMDPVPPSNTIMAKLTVTDSIGRFVTVGPVSRSNRNISCGGYTGGKPGSGGPSCKPELCSITGIHFQ